jgi:hypothetical protein
LALIDPRLKISWVTLVDETDVILLTVIYLLNDTFGIFFPTFLGASSSLPVSG